MPTIGSHQKTAIGEMKPGYVRLPEDAGRLVRLAWERGRRRNRPEMKTSDMDAVHVELRGNVTGRADFPLLNRKPVIRADSRWHPCACK